MYSFTSRRAEAKVDIRERRRQEYHAAFNGMLEFVDRMDIAPGRLRDSIMYAPGDTVYPHNSRLFDNVGAASGKTLHARGVQ